MFRITDFANCGPARHGHLAQLTGPESQGCKSAFTSNQLHTSTGATRDLRTLSRSQFDAVHSAAYRYLAQQQTITRPYWNTAAGHQLITRRDTTRRDYIASFTISVQKQSDMSTSIWIVLDPLHLRRNTVLTPHKIHNSVTLLVTATAMPRSNPALVVAATGASLLGEQWTVRPFLVQACRSHLDYEPPSRRSRLCWNHCHSSVLRS